MSQIENHPGCREGETAWEWIEEGSVVFRRSCDRCDKGLLYAPVRFCSACEGSGWLLRFPTPKRIYVYDGPGDDAKLLCTVDEEQSFEASQPRVWLDDKPRRSEGGAIR